MRTAITACLVFVCLSFCRQAEPDAQNTPGTPHTTAPAKIRLQMGWIPDAHQAGFWVALDDGIYRRAGLDVEILPGGTDTSAPRSVATGAAQFGQISGMEQLIAARASGLPIVAIAAIHRHSPHALISLRQPIRQPNDLRGKRIAVAFGDAAEIHFKNLLRRSAIPQTAVQLVPFRFSLQPLIEGDVDAVTGFSTDQPFVLEASGLTPTVLAYRDFGLEQYGYALIAAENVEPALADRFLAASREGWTRAIVNPTHAVDVLARRFPGSVQPATELRKLAAITPLMVDSTGSLASWELHPDVIRRAQDDMFAYGQLREAVDATRAIRNAGAR